MWNHKLLHPLLFPCCLALSGCGEFVIFSQPSEVPPYQAILETFEQTAVPKRDILWVIDNTRSMDDELAELAPLFDTFISDIVEYGISYQVGIITVNVEEDRGQLQGIPSVITAQIPDAGQAFSDNVLSLVSEGSGSERGLDAVLLALSSEATSFGGSSYGFLRQDAGLSIVVVSDADDQSLTYLQDPAYASNPVGYYAEWLQTLKGGISKEEIIFSAIVGPEDACPGAESGTRYLELAALLNGITGSICDANFDSVVDSIGKVQVALESRFPLLHEPVGSISVSVDGTPQVKEVDWHFDQLSNSVIFFSGKVPPYKSRVTVSYLYRPDTA